MTPRQRFNVTLDPEQIEKLRVIESVTGAPASAQIRKALDLWFEKHAHVFRLDSSKEARKRK